MLSLSAGAFTDGNLKYKVLSTAERTVSVTGYVEKPTGELVIPASAKDSTVTYTVVSIGKSAFNGCTGVTSLSLPATLRSIDNEFAFAAVQITELVLPDSLKYIGFGAFQTCSALKKITFGKGLEEIGEQAFLSCSALMGGEHSRPRDKSGQVCLPRLYFAGFRNDTEVIQMPFLRHVRAV